VRFDEKVTGLYRAAVFLAGLGLIGLLMAVFLFDGRLWELGAASAFALLAGIGCYLVADDLRPLQ
jgi:hypothetical protein